MMCLAVKLSSASKSLLTTIANRNYRANPSGLILLKKIRKFAQNKQTNKQTDKQTNKQTDREFNYRGHSYPLWIVGGSGPISRVRYFESGLGLVWSYAWVWSSDGIVLCLVLVLC